MTRRALLLTHAIPVEHRRDSVGTLLPALERRGFDVDVHGADDGADLPPPTAYDLLVPMGGHDSVYDDFEWIARERAWLADASAADVPIFGVCFGAQLLATAVDGAVARSETPEYGAVVAASAEPELVGEGPWLEFHQDVITDPGRARVVAKSDGGVQAIAVRRGLGVQFHPEVSPAWIHAWEASVPDMAGYLRGHGVDLQEIVDHVDRHAADLAARCDALLDSYLHSVGLSPAG